MNRTHGSLAALAALALLGTSACSVDSGGDKSKSSASGDNKVITLVTHDSWAPDAAVMKDFTKKTGYTVKVQKSGDAGELANKLVLNKDNPSGDVVFGIDNTFASRVTSAGVFDDYTPSNAPASASKYALPDGQGNKQLSPVDFGDVCVNVDNAWFTKNKKKAPASFEDLIKPEYKNLMVTPGAATSSPGMGFLLATVGKFGQNGWQDYWKKLMANGVKLTSGWTDAWNVDYTAGGGNGKRPIVVSYDTSPADTVDKAGKTTTSSLNNTCFRSVEYTGILKGAKNKDGAKALIDFMNDKPFQQSLPNSMYVLPINSEAKLPSEWEKNVKIATKPYSVPPQEINAKRQEWLQKWQDITTK